jgi:hypothetical protein
MEGLAEATSAAAGALTSAAVLYPLDLVKTRIQSQLVADGSSDEAQQLEQYSGIADGFAKIWRTESFGGFYAGVGGYSLKASVDNFTYFFWRRFMMTTASRLLGRDLGGLLELVISNVAGILHKLLNLPLDVVSTRQQTARDGSSMLANARAVVALKGWGGLWDGLGPTLLLTTNPAITYTCFDAMKRALIGQRAKLGFLESFLVGVGSKAVATVIIYPLIRAKVLQQRAQKRKDVETSGGRGVLASIVGVFTLLAHVARTEGVLSWYTGMPGQITKASLSSALLLMTKEQINGLILAAFGLAAR